MHHSSAKGDGWMHVPALHALYLLGKGWGCQTMTISVLCRSHHSSQCRLQHRGRHIHLLDSIVCARHHPHLWDHALVGPLQELPGLSQVCQTPCTSCCSSQPRLSSRRNDSQCFICGHTFVNLTTAPMAPKAIPHPLCTVSPCSSCYRIMAAPAGEQQVVNNADVLAGRFQA